MSKSDNDTAADPDDHGDSVLTLTDPAPEDVADELEAEAAAEPEKAEPGGFKRRLVAALIVLLTIGAATAVVLLSINEYRHRQDESLRTQAVQMSREYLVAMAAFDYQKMDANREHIAANSTPGFAAKYDEMVKALRDIVVTSKGVATATADHVVIESLDADTATVVAFVDQHVTNVTAPQGSNQKYRMVVKLVRSGDRWIVDDVQTV